MDSIQTNDWIHDICNNEKGDVHDSLVGDVHDLFLP